MWRECQSDNAAEIDKALTGFESIDEIAIVAAPGLEGGAIWNLLVAHCNKMEDRFAILDSQADVETNGELDVKLLNYTNPEQRPAADQQERRVLFPLD